MKKIENNDDNKMCYGDVGSHSRMFNKNPNKKKTDERLNVLNQIYYWYADKIPAYL